MLKNKAVEINHAIDFRTGGDRDVLWSQLPFKTYHSYGPFSFGCHTANIKVYPNGNKNRRECSLYVQLLPKQTNSSISNDQGMVQVAITVTSNYKNIPVTSYSAPLSKFAAGWGLHNISSDINIKTYDSMNVKIKMNQCIDDDTQQMKAAVTKQAELLYKLSKANGDITLIISKNDVQVDTQPPLKRRRLNEDNNHNNISDVKDNEEGIDIEIKNEMKVTGVILQSASTVFNAMLSTNMMEKKKKIIEIKAESVEDVDNMYYCIITNKLRRSANAKNILVLADLYQIDTLKYECAKRMLNNVKVDNCIDIINLFDRYAIKQGYNTLIRFAKTNIKKLTKQANFDGLSHSLKMTLLN